MTVRTRAKAAVKRAFAATASHWIPIEFLVYSNNRYDPRNPEANSTREVVTVRAVEDGYSHRHVDGDKVRQSDRRFYIDPDTYTIEPKITDQVRISGTIYEIVNLIPIQQDVLLEMQLRGMS